MRRKQSGLTLTELVVTVAIAAVLLAVAVPAAKRITRSLRDSAGTRALVGAALSNARAIAVRQGKYAGVWVHQVNARDTYLVLMVHDERSVPAGGTGRANGFRPVEGRKVILLPENTALNSDVGSIFPIVFNPAGKLVTYQMRFSGRLPFTTPPGSLYTHGYDLVSVNRFRISDPDEPGIYKTLMVSPYSGELIGD